MHRAAAPLPDHTGTRTRRVAAMPASPNAYQDAPAPLFTSRPLSLTHWRPRKMLNSPDIRRALRRRLRAARAVLRPRRVAVDPATFMAGAGAGGAALALLWMMRPPGW